MAFQCVQGHGSVGWHAVKACWAGEWNGSKSGEVGMIVRDVLRVLHDLMYVRRGSGAISLKSGDTNAMKLFQHASVRRECYCKAYTLATAGC